MKFDDYQPKLTDVNLTYIAYNGDEYDEVAEADCCIKCGEKTKWGSISFEAPLCSTECADAMWKEYWDSFTLTHAASELFAA